MLGLLLTGTQAADDLLLQSAFVLGCGQVTELAFERAVEPLVGIKVRTVAGQVMHSDDLAMFPQPCFYQLAVMHPQVVEDTPSHPVSDARRGPLRPGTVERDFLPRKLTRMPAQ